MKRRETKISGRLGIAPEEEIKSAREEIGGSAGVGTCEAHVITQMQDESMQGEPAKKHDCGSVGH